jgi:putative methyltransferase (TIGR04325 family)
MIGTKAIRFLFNALPRPAREFGKALAAKILSPSALAQARRAISSVDVTVIKPDGTTHEVPEWEMVPAERAWQQMVGWSHQSIVERQAVKWDAFAAAAASPRALARSHEAEVDSPLDATVQNTIMCFAYVLGRSLAEAGRDERIGVLDWGGGLGHYFVYARELYPEASIRYVVVDMEGLCVAGSERNPGAEFTADARRVLAMRHDLVVASSSIQYERDVYGLIDDLCRAAGRYLYVTRTPFVEKVDDFVVVQRPHRYGYHTEYAGWFLNRGRFVAHVESRGFCLAREFVLAERPYVANATEQCVYAGFLFKRVTEAAD